MTKNHSSTAQERNYGYKMQGHRDRSLNQISGGLDPLSTKSMFERGDRVGEHRTAEVALTALHEDFKYLLNFIIQFTNSVVCGCAVLLFIISTISEHILNTFLSNIYVFVH